MGSIRGKGTRRRRGRQRYLNAQGNINCDILGPGRERKVNIPLRSFHQHWASYLPMSLTCSYKCTSSIQTSSSVLITSAIQSTTDRLLLGQHFTPSWQLAIYLRLDRKVIIIIQFRTPQSINGTGDGIRTRKDLLVLILGSCTRSDWTLGGAPWRGPLHPCQSLHALHTSAWTIGRFPHEMCQISEHLRQECAQWQLSLKFKRLSLICEYQKAKKATLREKPMGTTSAVTPHKRD